MKPLRIVDVVKGVKAIDYTSSNRFDVITNVQFDSRLCDENSLFIPLMGQTDGHDYVEKAIEKGAKATLWSKDQASAPENISVIFVDDTLEALQLLAAFYLNMINPKVVGITGSNGKTTTKDMIGAILSERYRVHKTNGNYNNEIGVPKTILDMPENTDIAVIEMGMDGFGQISQLSQLVKPDVAVITVIGDSHLEFLKSREGIAKAKLEILDGLNPDGVLIIPQDEPLLIDHQTDVKVLTFGESKQSTLSIRNVTVNNAQTTFQIAGNDAIVFELPIIGAYNAKNAAAALIVGRFFNVPESTMANALKTFQLTANRTEWLDGINGSKLLNDAYNASPTSMRAILRDFMAIDATAKKYVVLGDMRELGDQSDVLHASLVDAIHLNNVDGVFLYGTHMKALALSLNSCKVAYFAQDEKDALMHLLKGTLQKDDVVLVKSSYGTNLLEVVAFLRDKSEQ